MLNGPNLNFLGVREPGLYGSTTLPEIVRRLEERAAELGLVIDAFQSNHEGELVDHIQEWARDASLAGVVVNPGGLTHTSVTLRDALLLLSCPVVEVHITNLAAREPFRRRSLISGIAAGVVSGLGVHGYLAALEYVAASRPSQTSGGSLADHS